jgi:hypothetical protein
MSEATKERLEALRYQPCHECGGMDEKGGNWVLGDLVLCSRCALDKKRKEKRDERT